jgi:hypothetical protein
LNFLWNGAIPEWTLHGVSTKIVEKTANPQGQEHTNVPVSFHVTRKARYYFWKALLPLYLLTLLSMSTFHTSTVTTSKDVAQLFPPISSQPLQCSTW